MTDDFAAHARPEDTDPSRWDNLYLTRSALRSMKRGTPLIDGVIDAHALGCISGRDGTFKSFLVLDWLCCLATGKSWLGRPVERVKGLYVVGEGAWGLDDRVTAWETAWGHEVDDDWFHTRRAPVNLYRRREDFEDLLARVRAEAYGIVIFDTLQKMSAGADHNSSKDAGIIIESLAAVRDAATHGSAWVVTHTDKGDRDTRGSSVFEDDLDTVWHLRCDEDTGAVEATQTKRKDGPVTPPFTLRPEAVKGTRSLVLGRSTGWSPGPAMPKQAIPILRLLASPLYRERGASASALADDLGLKGKGSAHKALNSLIEDKSASTDDRGRWPVYKITVHGLSTLADLDTQAADQR